MPPHPYSKEMAIDIDIYRTELARRLGQLRIQFGLSQRDFLDTLGLGQNIIFRSEGDLNISIEALLKLALYYIQTHQINPDWLFNPDNMEIPQLNEQALQNRRKVTTFDRIAEEVRVAELV